jgi:type I restriction enzyme M protein
MARPDTAAGKAFATQQSLNRAIKGICDVLRRSNCAGAMQYIPELTWILFLRILEEREAPGGLTLGPDKDHSLRSLESPFRWQDWAAPYRPTLFDDPLVNKAQGWKRYELEKGREGALLEFVNNELFPYLKSLGSRLGATPRQVIISEIAVNIGRTRIDTQYNLLDVLNRVHEITAEKIDHRHIFPISQVYEGLLLQMGHKSNDGGQFFTPREVVRAMVKIINPQFKETIYDPCCGTGGFLAQAYEYIRESSTPHSSDSSLSAARVNQYYGREKENLVYPLALANLVLHGIDEPHVWHGNTLTGDEVNGRLFHGAPSQFDVILTNPPFGGKESRKAQDRFDYKASSTQLLFLQHIIDSLGSGGRCGMVVDEGILFRTSNSAFVNTKRRLLDTCNLWCIVSLPLGAFVNAGASIKTNLLFFTKGTRTEKVWYYDLSDLRINKATPLASEHFEDLYEQLANFCDSERSWSVDREQIESSGYDLKAVNPNFQVHQEERDLSQLISLIEAQNQEIQHGLRELSLFFTRQNRD